MKNTNQSYRIKLPDKYTYDIPTNNITDLNFNVK